MNSVVVLLIIFIAGLVYMLVKKKAPSQNDGVSALLKQDLTEISRGMNELKESLGSKIDSRLEKSQASMGQQLESSAKLIKEVTERLTRLDETNKRVVDVADELKQLQNVLQNPKKKTKSQKYEKSQDKN